MIRWGLFLIAITSNVVWLVSSIASGFVTWAQVVPKDISCSVCSEPEVQAALIQAATYGRTQILNQLPSIWFVSVLALFNILVIGLLLFKFRSNPSFKRDA
ncbi:MAG: hypothetical protein U1E01_22815 [Methylicorpusculum sp.]|nr:hypothetical protein [Methylicorpusculum sp.]